MKQNVLIATNVLQYVQQMLFVKNQIIIVQGA
jgi:hypothetical protein